MVAVTDDYFHEGFHSLLDAEPRIVFDRFARGMAIAPEVQAIAGVQRVAAFSKGFYKLRLEGDRVLLSDLRMGQEPNYIFTFEVAQRHSAPEPTMPPVQVGTRLDLARGLPWLWRRTLGEPVAPPR